MNIFKAFKKIDEGKAVKRKESSLIYFSVSSSQILKNFIHSLPVDNF